MNYGELLELLEISSPEEFEYFENVADLIECERVIGEEALTELFAQINGSIFSELIENYFSELLEKIPDRAIRDLYADSYNWPEPCWSCKRNGRERGKCIASGRGV